MYVQIAFLKFQIPLMATYSKEIFRDMHRKHKYKSIIHIKKKKNPKLFFFKIEKDNQKRRRRRRTKRQKRNTNDF